MTPRNIGHEALDSQLNYPAIAWEKAHGQKVTEANLDQRIRERSAPNGCTGNCNQGDGKCDCPRNDYAGESQWESADAEVVAWFMGVLGWFVKACLAVVFAWSIAMLANALLAWVAGGRV